jgi:hypothetical protein
MKILTLGCSNSCFATLNQATWAEVLRERFPQHDFTLTGSAGAGNEFNLAKLLFTLERDSFDLVLFQLTEPARLTLGTMGPRKNYDNYANTQVGTATMYTFNAFANDENLTKLLGTPISVDSFMLEHALISDYNLTRKISSTLLAASAAAQLVGAKLIFWSWFTPMQQIVRRTGTPKLLESLNLVDGCADDKLRWHQEWRAPCYHWYTPAHEFLLDHWLVPEFARFGVTL